MDNYRGVTGALSLKWLALTKEVMIWL